MLNKRFKKGILVFCLLVLVFFVLPISNEVVAQTADEIYPTDWSGSIYEDTTSLPGSAVDNKKVGSVEGAVISFLSWVILGIALLLGKMLTIIMGIINWLFTWQEFDGQGAVTEGWVIVRDICNMAFILVLLLIAFATILRLENYSMKKYLPKLLIMAVLINFSKTICFLLIDVSQVVMLTFANAFTGAGGNFVTMLGIDQMINMSDVANFEDMTWGLFFASGLALILIIISFFVMIMLMGILIMRMVMFWVLIILSPLAFLATATPGGGKYFSQWWGEFTKYLIVGPVLAFFTWLSLRIAQNTVIFDNAMPTKDNASAFMNQIATKGGLESFIIAIGLLIGTIKITKSFGAMGAGFGAGLAASAAGGAIGFAKKNTFGRGASALKWGRDKAASGVKSTAKAGGRIGLATLGTADRLVGRGIDNIAGTKLGEKGVVASTGALAVNTPKNIRDALAAKRGEKAELKQAMRDYHYAKLKDPNADMKYDGKKYRADSNGELKEVVNGNITANSLTVNGKAQKEMGAIGVAAYDSWKKSQSRARGALNVVQQKEIEKASEELKNEDTGASELHQIMNDKTASSTKKMAAALKLGKDGDFNDLAAIEHARKLLQANQAKLKELNDEVDKNQAHQAYDFTTQAGRDKFKKRVDRGKIDTTKMHSDAYKDQNVIKALEEYHGKDTTRVMETAFKRGKKYEASVANGLSGARNLSNLKDDKFAKLHAKLTGNIAESFKDAANNIDFSSLENYFKNAKAADFNKISRDNLHSMVNNNTGAHQSVADNVSYAKLKSMHRQGDNPELVRELRDIILTHNSQGSSANNIRADQELMSV